MDQIAQSALSKKVELVDWSWSGTLLFSFYLQTQGNRFITGSISFLPPWTQEDEKHLIATGFEPGWARPPSFCSIHYTKTSRAKMISNLSTRLEKAPFKKQLWAWVKSYPNIFNLNFCPEIFSPWDIFGLSFLAQSFSINVGNAASRCFSCLHKIIHNITSERLDHWD